jgi:uncharacterized membrane protein
MSTATKFGYLPGEHETEKASNSYLMSLVALLAGLPFPIINLLATFFFFLANRQSTYFVRWHCIQALLSQFSLLLMNSYGFWWTISILFSEETVGNGYMAYMLTILLFNITEMGATIYSAIQTRKGIHVEWWFYGALTNLLCKPRTL